jgi:hypothetical protein
MRPNTEELSIAEMPLDTAVDADDFYDVICTVLKLGLKLPRRFWKAGVSALTRFRAMNDAELIGWNTPKRNCDEWEIAQLMERYRYTGKTW